MNDREDHQEQARQIARARDGDREAQAWLVERNQDLVFALCCRLTRGKEELAEDLAQETFLRALKGLPRFRGDAAFSTWLHRIAVNLHLNREALLSVKAERRTIPLGNGRGDEELPTYGVEVPDAGPSPHDQAELAEESSRALGVLDELSEERRIVVVLRDLRDLSYEEIAEILEVPIGTVRSRLFRAREELRQRLYGDLPCPGP